MFDGLGMGLGFTIALTLIGLFREILGNGTAFNVTVMPKVYEPITIFVLAPGAFFVLAFLVAIQNKIRNRKAVNVKPVTSCDAGCAGCASAGICGGHEKQIDGEAVSKEQKQE